MIRKLAIIATALSLALVAPVSAQVANGKVTTSDPTYVNNTANGLSLTTTGHLRVTSGGGGTITPVPQSAPVTTTAVTAGLASALALAAGARDYLMLMNASAGSFISCNFGGTAVVNGAGSITLSPYQSFTWEGSFVPSDAVNCIASAAAQPLTILSSAQ